MLGFLGLIVWSWIFWRCRRQPSHCTRPTVRSRENELHDYDCAIYYNTSNNVEPILSPRRQQYIIRMILSTKSKQIVQFVSTNERTTSCCRRIWKKLIMAWTNTITRIRSTLATYLCVRGDRGEKAISKEWAQRYTACRWLVGK